MTSLTPSNVLETANTSKETRRVADQILATLQNHHFSDTSLSLLVDILLKHALSGPSHSAAIATLCAQLKTNIRWHATASQSAAFLMMLSARVGAGFYRDWETTSKVLESWTTLLAELFIHGVVSIYNVWHAALHVARCFDSPSQLTAVVVALERCKAHQPSEPIFDSCSGLADKVLQRLDILEIRSGTRLGESRDLYCDVISRIRALGTSTNVPEGRGPGTKMPLLEGVMADLELALEAREKARAGKSKAE
ncbi:hypothetical protein FA13DRAFT_1818205 [Coprinellus micaceus]|uniref:Uncharacterized protein n=1 Tax=Coprinellus micaceus TaxID=71717 RepID=A0A4Y7SQ93_COPMI|nr:hypothetical protein FA13DRAFT_1820255 [Coprinellus micaceus]TEB23828.1 hypothetical protein FA13DRAFT_1818205 [Coprinellus micaceus]